MTKPIETITTKLTAIFLVGLLAIPLPILASQWKCDSGQVINSSEQCDDGSMAVVIPEEAGSVDQQQAPSPVGISDSDIIQSYRDAFGREPNDGELQYWRSVPASDDRVASPEALFRNHLQYLKNSQPEREATAIRAIHAAYTSEENNYPALKNYLDDPRSPAVKNAIIDMMAGRNGGGFNGILSYLQQPEVKEYYNTRDGIEKFTLRPEPISESSNTQNSY